MPVAFKQTGEEPVMADVVGKGEMATAKLTAGPKPHILVSTTETVPGVDPKVTVI